MKKVLTFGVFDYFHYGHLRLLERAKMLGDYLIVAVQEDDEINKNKPNEKIIYSLEKRLFMLKALRCVDEAIPYKQVCDDIVKIDFDILVIGPDQNHEGIQKAVKWCKENKKEVITLDRTPNISSTEIKRKLKKDN